MKSEPEKTSLWYILDAKGEPVPEEDRDKVEAFLKGDRFLNGRCVAETRVGPAKITTTFMPVAIDDEKTKWWETLVERGSDDSMPAPDYEKCGGPRAAAMAQHERHVLFARAFIAATPKPYNAAHPLIIEWQETIQAQRTAINDRGHTMDWFSLAMGWALGRGLPLKLAEEFAFRAYR